MTDDEAVEWLTDEEIGAFTASTRPHLVTLAQTRKALIAVVEGAPLRGNAYTIAEIILSYQCPRYGMCPGRVGHPCSGFMAHSERIKVAELGEASKAAVVVIRDFRNNRLADKAPND